MNLGAAFLGKKSSPPDPLAKNLKVMYGIYLLCTAMTFSVQSYCTRAGIQDNNDRGEGMSATFALP